MRIAVVSPHLPTPALPMRGVSHDEQLRLFVEAGHEVRAVVPLPWSPRRWLAGAPIPDEERDGGVLVTHPRYLWLPRYQRGATLERRLFARAAATALALGGAAPDVVLAHSASLPGALLGRIGGAAFVVSPLGIATHVAPSAIRPQGFTVCTVTRLIARKRVDRLIFAFARLAAARPDARLVIVGDGPEQPALKQLVRALGIESLVELT